MEGVYGRCWAVVAKGSAFQRTAAAMPAVGTFFNTGGLKPFPRLARPPYMNLLKGFLFPADEPGTQTVGKTTVNPVFNNTLNRINLFFNRSWSPGFSIKLSKVFGGVGTFFQKGPDPPEAKSMGAGRTKPVLLARGKLSKSMHMYFPGPGQGILPEAAPAEDRQVNPVIKNIFESLTRDTLPGVMGSKIIPLVLPGALKKTHVLFNGDGPKIDNRHIQVNSELQSTGVNLLKPFQTGKHQRTDHARHIIQHMKETIINAGSHQRTVNNVETLHKDIRESTGNQEQMMMDISTQLTDMNRKIDFLQAQQKRTGPLINANRDAKDGGFYDY